MTAFVYYTATTANGFIADPDNSLSWLFGIDGADPDTFGEFLGGIGVQVMGSTTYLWLVEHENVVDEPEKWRALFGDLVTRVFSTRELDLPRGADIDVLRGPVAQHVDDLIVAAGGKDVWIVGGGDLAGQFLDAGRLDRIELDVAPAFLTGGAPLLPRDVPSAQIRLVSAEPRGPFARLVFDVVSTRPVADLYVAAVAIRDADDRILVVRKRGTNRYMLPGGKIEPGETPVDTAVRELREEVGVTLDPSNLTVLGDWTAAAANEPGLVVHGHVFTHPWVPGAHANAEIEDLQWLTPAQMRTRTDLAPLLEFRVLPALIGPEVVG